MSGQSQADLQARLAKAHYEKSLGYSDKAEQFRTSCEQTLRELFDTYPPRVCSKALREAGFPERDAQIIVSEALDPKKREKRLEKQKTRQKARDDLKKADKDATTLSVPDALGEACRYITEDATQAFQARIVRIVERERNNGKVLTDLRS